MAHALQRSKRNTSNYKGICGLGFYGMWVFDGYVFKPTHFSGKENTICTRRLANLEYGHSYFPNGFQSLY
jgi:hypothetical protein